MLMEAWFEHFEQSTDTSVPKLKVRSLQLRIVRKLESAVRDLTNLVRPAAIAEPCQ